MDHHSASNEFSAVKKIEKYAAEHTTPPSAALQALERETWLKSLQPQMMPGLLQGRLLSMISRMVKPKRVLEIGTFTGYSALCLAEGMTEDGELHTIERNEELEFYHEKYVTNCGKNIIIHYGNALTVIPKLEGHFDLIFIDAGKPDYPHYFDAVIDKTNVGGWIIADNVLWFGKVTDAPQKGDMLVLDQFNKKIMSDDRVKNLLLPLRDGLMIIEKVY